MLFVAVELSTRHFCCPYFKTCISVLVLCKYYYAVLSHFSFILFRFHRFLVFLLLVLQYFLFLFVTWLMLSRGVDVGFPSEIVISLVFFIIFSLINAYFHQFRVFLHSFFEIFRITAFFNMYFELLYENFTRSRDCDVTFKMEVNRELFEE